MNNVNPVVGEGIRRSFSRLDVHKPEFKEKAEKMLYELLEMQYKDVIQEWKNKSREISLEDKQQEVDKAEIFDKIAEEVLTEFETAIMESSENKELAKDKIRIIRKNIEKDNASAPIRNLIKKLDKEVYVEYLKYKRMERSEKKEQLKNELEQTKKDVDKAGEELNKAEKELATTEEQLATYKKEIEEEEQIIGDIQQATIDFFEKDIGVLRSMVELSKKKREVLMQVLKLKQNIYDDNMKFFRLEEIITNAEITRYTGERTVTEEKGDSPKELEVPNSETENYQEINSENISEEEPKRVEKPEQSESEEISKENLETNVLFQQMQGIVERSRQANTPEELIAISEELAKVYLEKIKEDKNNQKEITNFLAEIPQGKGMQLLGLFFLNGRKAYMQVTGKENLTKEDLQFIELMKNERNGALKYLKDRFPGQEINIPPLQTEEEYFEELKSIELEMIKIERNIETKKHFIFGKRRNSKEEEGKEDITEKMMQMYSELSQVIDVTKTNNMQRTYNRIIRKLKRMPDIDDSKIPPALKEMVVQRVETPLPSTENITENSESRKMQRQGENIGDDGPLME